jgi:putative polyketide hydroxylase
VVERAERELQLAGQQHSVSGEEQGLGIHGQDASAALIGHSTNNKPLANRYEVGGGEAVLVQNPRETTVNSVGEAHPDVEVPVLVIGAGPAGLSSALALGRLGVSCVLVERRSEVGGHPRATGIRSRTMELFRSWGVHEAVERRALPAPDGPEFAWVHTVAGEEFGRLVIGADLAGRLARQRASTSRTVFCPQDRLEPVLLDAVRSQPTVGVRLGAQVCELELHDSGADATLRDVHTGATRRIRAQYVLACDGAGSPARTAAGIGMHGPDLAVQFVSIYFEADLRPWVGAAPPALHWVLNSRSSGGLVTLDGRHRWLLQAAQQPPAQTPGTSWSTRVVRDAVGVDDLPVTIGKVFTWRMTAQVADRFRQGGMFLVGDSAHRFPPTGGFGMNTGIQDAHNLAWKLHAVLEGWAGPGLLDTYEQERRPIAEFNTRQSQQNMVEMADTGFGPDVYTVAAELETGSAEARRRLRAAISRQLAQFDALGQDLGFRYEAGALIPDGSPVPPVQDRQLSYVPKAAPGFRAPHHVLHREGRALSTLDLFGESFVLLAGPGGADWVQAALAEANASGVPLAGYRVAADGDLVDLTGQWPPIYGVGDDGACLVRPDGHVGWRVDSKPPGDAGDVMRATFDQILSRA